MDHRSSQYKVLVVRYGQEGGRDKERPSIRICVAWEQIVDIRQGEG